MRLTSLDLFHLFTLCSIKQCLHDDRSPDVLAGVTQMHQRDCFECLVLNEELPGEYFVPLTTDALKAPFRSNVFKLFRIPNNFKCLWIALCHTKQCSRINIRIWPWTKQSKTFCSNTTWRVTNTMSFLKTVQLNVGHKAANSHRSRPEKKYDGGFVTEMNIAWLTLH